MNPQQAPRIRKGKAPNIFKRDWEEGHDPLKPYIEVKDENGNIQRKKPEGKAYNVCDMDDDELGDFLGEEEKKALAIARQQQKESKGRDICKEMQDKKDKEEKDRVEKLSVLSLRNQILEDHARQKEKEFADYKQETDTKIEKLASLLQQLVRRS